MKKNICIITSVIIAVLTVLGISGFVLNTVYAKEKKLEEAKKQEFTASVEKVESSSRTFTCLKDIMDQDEYTVYIEQKVSFYENEKITEYYAKTAYEFDTKEAYESLKDRLTNCEDTYEEDTTIRCDINKNDMEKSIIGGTYIYYMEQLEGQGFVCE